MRPAEEWCYNSKRVISAIDADQSSSIASGADRDNHRITSNALTKLLAIEDIRVLLLLAGTRHIRVLSRSSSRT